MALGRLLERLFVQVNADLSQMSSQLASGVKQTQTATNKMAMQWNSVSRSIDNLVADLKKGIITQGQYMTQLNRHSSQVAALSGNYRQAQKQVFQYAASLRKVSAVTPKAFNPQPVRVFTRSTGQARAQMLNLSFQLNDIGQTLATGMNPFTVMIQQGSQILQIYAGQGGVNTAMKDLGRIVAGSFRALIRLASNPVFIAIAAIVGGIVLSLKSIQKQAQGIGDSSAEFQRLRDEVSKLDKDIQAQIKTFVTFGDTVKAVFQVLIRKFFATELGQALIELGKKIRQTWNTILEGLPGVLDKGVNAFRVFVLAIGKIIQTVSDLFDKSFLLAVSNATFHLAALVGTAGRAVQGIAKALSTLPGVDIKVGQGIFDLAADIDQISVNSSVAAHNIGTITDALNEFKKEAADLLKETPVSDLFNEIADQATNNAIERIKRQIEEAGDESDKAAKKVKTLAEILQEELKEAADNLAGVFGNAFERLVETGKFTFKDFIKDLNRLITRSTSQLLQDELSKMFQNLAKSQGGLGSMLSNLFTSLFSGKSTGLQLNNQSGGLGDFFSGVGKMLGFASGGVAMPFQNFMTDERGFEAKQQDGPAGAMRIRSAGQTAAMMRQMQPQPITIVQNISTPDVESFRQSQSQLAARATMFLARGRRNQ